MVKKTGGLEQHLATILVGLIGVGVATLVAWVIAVKQDVETMKIDIRAIRDTLNPVVVEIQKQQKQINELDKTQAIALKDHERYDTMEGRVVKLEGLSHGHSRGLQK